MFVKVAVFTAPAELLEIREFPVPDWYHHTEAFGTALYPLSQVDQALNDEAERRVARASLHPWTRKGVHDEGTDDRSPSAAASMTE
jgi:hypothetical protein